jgi:Acetyltransferase (GNAT) domain
MVGTAEMVTIERRVHRLLRYRKFWFPTQAQAMEISKSLRPNDVVRFFAVSPAPDALLNVVEQYRIPTVWIHLAAGPAAVLHGMKRRSCRKEIRRAEKMLGRVVIERGSEKSDRDFLAVYNEFTQAKGLPRLRARWVEENSAHCETFVLYLDGSALCSHLVLRDPETKIVRPLYSGSRRLESPEQASACGALNRYLHWHEMQRYYEEGYANYDFGGLGEESIARFKLSFGGSILRQHFYLLSGMQWVAKLGKFVYERIRDGRTFQPDEHSPYESAEEADISAIEARP